MAIAENRGILRDANGAQIIVAEQTTQLIRMLFVEDSGALITSSAVWELMLTLYNRDSVAQEIINGVDAVDIFNTGRGEFGEADGTLLLTLGPDDNIIVDAANDLEWHRALIEWSYGADGAKRGKYEIEFPVRNLSKVGS